MWFVFSFSCFVLSYVNGSIPVYIIQFNYHSVFSKWPSCKEIHLPMQEIVGSIPGSKRYPGEVNVTTSVFLPGYSHEERNLVGYSP